MSGKRAIAFAEWSMNGLLESSGGGEPYAGREEYMSRTERKGGSENLREVVEGRRQETIGVISRGCCGRPLRRW